MVLISLVNRPIGRLLKIEMVAFNLLQQRGREGEVPVRAAADHLT